MKDDYAMPLKRILPVLKWAGGKSQLLGQIIKRVPETYNDYYEPFVGGAAVLLYLQPQQAFINDINAQLINLYNQLKVASKLVIDKVKELDSVPCTKERYYSIREEYNRKISNHILDSECAALMIWINKHCFNGLYRVNQKGLFNVPYNNKVKGNSIDEENINSLASYFSKANIQISCKDFEEACETVKNGDLVYFDSPYIPESDTAYFTDYSKGGFQLEDHKRLATLFRKLDNKGAKVMLSNNDVPLVWELYDGYHIEAIEVKRMINSNANKRTGKEVLITNY